MSPTTTISLSSESSSFLSTTVHPELDLDERDGHYNYSCGLLDFSILIPNHLDAKADLRNATAFHFNFKKDPKTSDTGWELKTLHFFTGELKLSIIIEAIEKAVHSRGHKIKFFFDEHVMKYRVENPEATLEINCEPTNSIMSIFGFDRRRLYGHKYYWADHSIYPIESIANTIRVNCDLVDASSSFHNGVSSHTLHEFIPSRVINYKMNERPLNHIYLPIVRQRICNVNISVTDQDGKPIRMVKGGRIICLIGIKKNKQTATSSIKAKC